jgi:hypothetical protein
MSATGESPAERSWAGPVLAPVSVGELIDKIVILEIKAARITDPAKASEVSKELKLLNEIDYGTPNGRQEIESLKKELRQVNEALWDIEDRIRDCEQRRDFDPDFAQLARVVYMTNDRRLKRRINEVSGSAIREIKVHPSY